jgi:hypothetical protein
MARWPRPGAEEPPAELRSYRLNDWLGRCEPTPWRYPGSNHPAYLTPYETWRHAQFEWLRQDHNRRINGMDALDVVFVDDC